MKEAVGFGVLGLGWPGVQHSRAALGVPGARLAAACDADPGRREQFSKDFPDVRVHERHEDLFADPSVDVVVIGLPNFLHAPMTLAAFAAGKHVLCEKPPTLDVAEIQEIRRESNERNLVYAFGRQFRFTSDMLDARAAIEAGQLGSIYLAKSRWLRLRGAPAGVGGWFTEKKRAGGGAIIDLGIHSLDNAWYLCGCPSPVSVSAMTGRFFPGEAPGDVEDTGVAFIRFQGGLVLSLEIAWVMNMSDEGASPVEWTGAESIQTLLHGTDASLQLAPPTIFRGDDKRLHRLEVPAGPSRADAFAGLPEPLPGFARQIADVAAAVRNGTAPVNHVNDAVELMKMLAGIYESARAQTEVRFESVPTDSLSVCD